MARKIKNLTLQNSDKHSIFYTPIMMDWGLFDVIKVRVCNPFQIGYSDYPGAPYIWVNDYEGKHIVGGGLFKVDWHLLYKNKKDAIKKGPSICKCILY